METKIDRFRVLTAAWLGLVALTLVGLGLNKMHRKVTLQDTPSVRGMIASVQHLVRVVDEA